MFHCGISADEILHCIFSLYLVYFFPPSLFRTLLSPLSHWFLLYSIIRILFSQGHMGV